MQLKKQHSHNTPHLTTGQTRINLTASSVPEVMEIGCELAIMRAYCDDLRAIIGMLREVRDMQDQAVVTMRRAG